MKNRLKKTLSIIILVIGILIFTKIAFCKDFEKVRNIPEDAALVYIYRPFKIVGIAVADPIIIGDNEVILLSNDSYYPILVKPGELFIAYRDLVYHRLGHLSITNAVKLEAKAGQTYYIQAIGKLMLVPPDVGEEKVKKCKLMTK